MVVAFTNPMAKERTKLIKPTATWKSIEQSFQSKAVTLAARKRQFFIFSKYAGMVLAVALVVGLAGFSVYWFRSNPHGMWLTGSSDPLRKIYFETDGVLTEEWLNEQLDIPRDAGLMDINIFAVQASLMEYGQTKHVTVERIFPDALRVKLRERMPVLRLVIMDAVGKKHLMLVSEEGEVYPGVNYHDETLARLPYLAGVSVKRADDGFRRLEGIPTVVELLREAREHYPKLYADWKWVSVEDFDGEPFELGAEIKIKTRSAGWITFKPYDFTEQLQELDAILLYSTYNRRWKQGKIAGIDLTLAEPVLSLATVATPFHGSRARQ